MEKYICNLCIYIYDPEQHDNISFESLPIDWVCPLCQAGKEEFSKIKPKIIVTQEDDEITLVSKKPLKINIEKKIRLSELFNVNDYNVIYMKEPYIIYKLK